MQSLFQLLLRSTDESILRKIMRVYIQMSNSGASISSVLTSKDIQQFLDEKRHLLSIRSEKLLAKF